MYTDLMNMFAWLINKHFGAFLCVCAVLAVWLSALALLLEYAVEEIRARICVRRDRRKYECR